MNSTRSKVFLKGISIVNFCPAEWHRLFSVNGDAYVFLSKDRQTLKIIRFKNHKRFLYDITYEKGYKFLQPVFEGNTVIYGLDFKYLAALLECPGR